MNQEKEIEFLNAQLAARTKQLNMLQNYCNENMINYIEKESLLGVGLNVYKRHLLSNNSTNNIPSWKKKNENVINTTSIYKTTTDLQNVQSGTNNIWLTEQLKRLTMEIRKSNIKYTDLINQKSKHIYNLEKKMGALKNHLKLLEDQGTATMSRELMELRRKLMKTKTQQASLKQENVEWKRKLDKKTKEFTHEQENSSKYQKHVIGKYILLKLCSLFFSL